MNLSSKTSSLIRLILLLGLAACLLPRLAVASVPTLNAISDVTVDEDQSAQVNLSGIGTGESGLATTLSVSATENGVLLMDNKVSYVNLASTGSLLLVPRGNEYGTSTITVTVTRGDGATVSRSFGLTVRAVNDAPVVGPANALNLNGINQFVSPFSNPTAITGSFTVEAWVRPENNGTGNVTLFDSSSPSDYGFKLTLESAYSQVKASIGNGSSVLGTKSTPLLAAFSQWFHFACVVTPGGYTLYVNGQQLDTTAFSGTPILVDASHRLRIGVSGTGTQYFKGGLADVRIWNIARTADEITRNFRAPVSPATTGLQINYPFNQTGGYTILDAASSSSLPLQGGGNYAFLFTSPAYSSVTNASFKFDDLLISQQYWSTPRETTLLVYLPARDTESNITYTSVAADHGTLKPVATSGLAYGTYYYTPEPGFTGDDYIRYTASDGTASNNTFTTVKVTAINTPPVAGPGTSLAFDGVDDYVRASTPEAVSGTFTVEAWVRPDDTTRTMAIIGTRAPSDYSFDIKFQNGNKIHADIGDGTKWLTTAADATFTYTAGQWYHVAMAVTPTTYRIFVNGTEVKNGTISGTPLFGNPSHYILLGSAHGNDEFWKGRLSNVRVWNTERTAQQVEGNRHTGVLDSSDGLVAYYRLNENSGKVAHTYRSANTGDLVNGPVWQPSDGPLKYMYFNGTTTYGQVLDQSALDVTGPITVEAWIRPATLGNLMGIVEKYDDSNGGYLLRLQPNGQVSFFTADNTTGTNGVQSTTSVLPSTWTHVAGVWDGLTARIYINGVLDASAAVGRNPKAGATPLYIGAVGKDQSYKFSGLIGDVRLWKVARTDFEIAAWRGGVASNATGLVANYVFSDPSATTVPDVATADGTQNASIYNWQSFTPSDLTLGFLEVVPFTEDSSFNLALPAYDAETTSLTYTGASAQYGQLTQVSGSVYTYTPPANYNGPDIITYTVSDGSLSSTARVYLQGKAVEDAPTLAAISDQTVGEGATTTYLPISLTDGDPELTQNLSITAVSSNTNLMRNPGIIYTSPAETAQLTFKPRPGMNGTNTITVTVTEPASGLSTSRSFKVVVAAVDDSPNTGPATALQFNGTNYVRVADFGSVVPTDEITVEFWQYVNAAAQQASFIIMSEAANNRMLAHVPWDDGSVIWDFGNWQTSGRLSYKPPVSILGSWQHFAFVASKTGNYMKIFRNGIEEASKPGMSSFLPVSAELRLGTAAGQFSEFRVWNVARTADQILAGMNSALLHTDPSLVAYYRFNQKPTSSLKDFASLVTQAGAQDGELVADAADNDPIWKTSTVAQPWQVSDTSLLALQVIKVTDNSTNSLFLPAWDAEDGLNLTWQGVSATAGTVSQVSGGIYSYQAPPGYDGLVTLTYSTKDTVNHVASGKLNIRVQSAQNAVPTISSIANVTVEENASVVEIPFSVSDDQDASALTITPQVTANPGFISTIKVLPGGNFRTLSIVPKPGEIGTVHIKLVAMDVGGKSAVSEFDLRIEPKPAYTVFDLGVLPGKNASFGTAINDRGAVGAYSTDTYDTEANPSGFTFSGIDNSGLVPPIQLSQVSAGSLAGVRIWAMNNGYTIAGSARNGSATIPWRKTLEGELENLFGLPSNTAAETRALNDTGTVVGFGNVGTNRHAFLGLAGDASLTDLGLAPAPFNKQSEAWAINSGGHIAGAIYSQTGDAGLAGPRRAMIYQNGAMAPMLNVPDDTNSIAYGLNSFDQAVGSTTSFMAGDSALSFDGSDDYVLQTNLLVNPSGTSAVAGAAAHTVEAWIKINELPASRSWPMLLGQEGAGALHWIINHDDSSGGNLQIGYYNGSSVYIPMKLGAWMHVAQTFEPASSALKVYVNGELVKSGTIFGVNLQGIPLSLGKPVGSDNWFKGALDEVRVWRTTRTAAEIATNYNRRLAGSEAGLVTSFNFDEGSGTSITTSTASGNLVASLGGSPQWTVRAGLPAPDISVSDPILQLDGVGSYASGPTLPLANSSFTIEFRAKRTATGSFDMAVSMGQGQNDKGLQIGFRPENAFTFGFWADDLNASTNYSDLNWHHWAVVYNTTNRTQRIYRDGIEVASRVSSAHFQGTGPILIGKSAVGTAFFKGGLDDFRVWSYSRTANQILAAKDIRLPGDTTGLITYYTFDEGGGNISANNVPGVVDASLQGAIVWAGRDNGSRRAFLYDPTSSRLQSLGTLPYGGTSEARAINDFGQVIGSALTSEGERAFLYSAGQMHDLNELLPEADILDGWVLQKANGINRIGAIVGTGLHNGLTRAFLGMPATVIGRSVLRPQGAVGRRPVITLLKKHLDDDTDLNAFYWSEIEGKLYAIRPVIARLTWYTSNDDLVDSPTGPIQITNRIVTVTANIWPKNPVIHIAGAPVDIQPAYTGATYTYNSLIYNTNNASVDPSSRVFNSPNTGYTVIHYLKTQGAQVNPITQASYFEVVRTVAENDSHAGLATVAATIGDEVIDPAHTEYDNKNGFVLHERAAYDGSGQDRAYDRGNRLGPIIPVNVEKPHENTNANPDSLVVVWYRTNSIGVAWASVPVKYSLAWPDDNVVDKIVIASQLGSGMLDAAAYPAKTIYNQPDITLPGFNPNEEHAYMPVDTLYALRHDLNAIRGYSDPYALLKYRDPATDRWRMKVYKVVPEQAPYFFTYTGTAGKEIQPPLPLSLMPLCQNSYVTPTGSLVGWQDYKGKVYARMAGPDGSNTNLVVRWYYPMQAGFYHPDSNVAIGDCLAWLDHHTSNELSAPNQGAATTGAPINVTYDIRWEDSNALQVGETLVHSKRGLPDIYNMANAQVIFDSLSAANPGSGTVSPYNPLGLETLTRFYDPLSARTIQTGVSIPAAIKRQSIEGKDYFPDLPWMLKVRLYYDPVNNWLSFRGYLDENFGVGEPLLLPNVLSERERNRLIQLGGGDSAWSTLIGRLYDLTRNPNRVDLSPKDNTADKALRLGLTTTNGVVIPETLGAGPKVLTAGLGGIAASQTKPGNALAFSGATNSLVVIGANDDESLSLAGTPFTIEFWAKVAAPTTEQYIFGQPSGAADLGQLRIGFRDGGKFAFDLGSLPASTGIFSTGSTYTDTNWHHWACTFHPETKVQSIYRDAVMVASRTNSSISYSGFGLVELGRFGANYFAGTLDEIRIWKTARTAAELRARMNKRLEGVQTPYPAGAGSEIGLEVLYRCDESTAPLINGNLATQGRYQGRMDAGVSVVVSSAPTGIPPRYITVAENNDSSLAGLPVALHVIRVDDGPFLGDLKVLPGDNVFDERLTLRHSSDFGGDPAPLTFQWFYKPIGADFDPTDLPVVTDASASSPGDLRGWTEYKNYPAPLDGKGVNFVTIGEGGESGLLTLSDNAFICRYRGYAVDLADTAAWSGWVGDPAGTADQPRAALAEGWVKRVIRGLNPFDARTSDFHSSPALTFSSMLIQAGERYEGPIAFNPSADAINKVGLIEAYTTVMERAKSLSIEGVPQVDFNPANNAILLAATKLSDLYMVLGNEAYADASDPTIGFGSGSQEYGSLASSIFAFQNQLDSMLEEELTLVRGRDDSAAGVAASPVYNRLYWNFTLGEGEVAYQQNYNIGDMNKDGFIDEKDARLLYPQGHGDAWGHYLTALGEQYALLRHPFFTWIPRTELVSVAGTAIKVDYLDERKFALSAAAKAKVGAEIVDLTYRLNYVDDPAGQWQGYKDTNPERAWGVTEWARRAGTGAYFDWLTGNAILPSVDPNPAHTGIDKIDRQTVRELQEIPSHYEEIQTHLDQADGGLNPLGLAKGVVPFDIDPSLVTTSVAGPGKTHYEQIQERALKAMNNAMSVWDEVNKATQALRQNQDTVEQFTTHVDDQERDYKNRLIEIFGYPYAGDMGAGKTYPSDYDGPDLYHYQYINSTELNGDSASVTNIINGFFTGLPLSTATNATAGITKSPYFPTDTTSPNATIDSSGIFAVQFPYSPNGWAFRAPATWGQRRSVGEIQLALEDCIQADARMKQGMIEYNNLVRDITDGVALLKARYQIQDIKVAVKLGEKEHVQELSTAVAAFQGAQFALNSQRQVISGGVNATITSIPSVVGLAMDTFAGLKAAFKYMDTALSVVTYAAIGSLRAGEAVYTQEITDVKYESQAKIDAGNFTVEAQQKAYELEKLIRQELVQRTELFNLAETLKQSSERYLAALSKGQRVVAERIVFRQQVSARTTESRYSDMTFRIFRNDALQKYRATFDLAQRYVFLAATAYDYDSNLLGTDTRGGRNFLTDIIRQRSLGQMINGTPVIGRAGLADPLARMGSNFDVLKTQLGFNNPQTETGRFSMRNELFRMRDTSNEAWRGQLRTKKVANLWDVPEFRRYCRSFAPESAGAQPGLVVRFPTTVTSGRNFFNWPLGGGDSAYDSSRFATRVRSVGVWFSGYNGLGLSQTPRVYLVPVGADVLTPPTPNDFTTRGWRVVDQALPVPFPIGANRLNDPKWIPINDSLGGSFAEVRRFSSFRAYHDSGDFNQNEVISDSRLVGRSVWNTEWMMVIPGQTFLANADNGLETFINSVTDIKLFFQTYSYSGN